MKKGKYCVLEIAHYFIQRSNHTLRPMKLDKLLYYANAIYLVEKDRPLFKEKIRRYKYGTRIDTIHKSFANEYGNNFIDKSNIKTYISNKDKEIIDVVFDFYNQYSTIKLSDMSHCENSPWDETSSFKKYISNKLIKNYFKDMLHPKQT